LAVDAGVPRVWFELAGRNISDGESVFRGPRKRQLIDARGHAELLERPRRKIMPKLRQAQIQCQQRRDGSSSKTDRKNDPTQTRRTPISVSALTGNLGSLAMISSRSLARSTIASINSRQRRRYS